jgi:hypothetical protein
MESVELLHTVRILSSHIAELGELVVALTDDPILRAKTLARLNEQTIKLNFLMTFIQN